ncbi:MAG TPA: NUDIX hydrolase [Candidatus Acidoferrales bacterium]|nr:NUDIX hydrolase [Candidatus Acidoferrales bacterium]
MTKSRAKVLESRTVYKGPLFSVRQEQVLEPGGVEVRRDVVVHHGSVVLLPVLPGGEILLVRQYRHSVGQYLWELVAGHIDRGEAPLAAARRELAEETGYRARRFRKLMDVFPTPGFLSEHMVIYSCHGLTAGTARPEADENIEARKFPRRELEKMIRTGRMRDAKSIASILFYWRFVAR